MVGFYPEQPQLFTRTNLMNIVFVGNRNFIRGYRKLPGAEAFLFTSEVEAIEFLDQSGDRIDLIVFDSESVSQLAVDEMTARAKPEVQLLPVVSHHSAESSKLYYLFGIPAATVDELGRRLHDLINPPGPVPHTEQMRLDLAV